MTVGALAVLVVTLFLLAVGNSSGTRGLIHAGGITGLVLSALAFYLSAAAVFQASYGRGILPLGDLRAGLPRPAGRVAAEGPPGRARREVGWWYPVSRETRSPESLRNH